MTAKRASSYMARTAFKLASDVDIGRFQTAWQDVTATTPILRTRIVDLPEQGLVQVIVDAPLQWTVVHSDLQQYFRDDRQKQVSLGTPLTWASIVEDSQNGKRFFVRTVHHALYDGWSMPLILEEVRLAYQGEPRRQQIPFQSFIKHIVDMNSEESSNFWQRRLTNSEASVFPALPHASYQPRTDRMVRHHITELQWPCSGITASAIVRVGLSLLIHQYTNTNDVIFGAIVSGRQGAVPGVERMLGPTIATVPVRIVLDPNSTVEDLLLHVQMETLEMTKFEQTGLQQIRRINTDIEQASHFQTLLVIHPPVQGNDTSDHDGLFQPASSDDQDVTNLEAFNIYAMTITCQLSVTGLKFEISFDSNVLPIKQAERMTKQLESILLQLCLDSNGSRKVADINLISQEDLHDIWSWNAAVPEPADVCVHDLFMRKAREQPEAPAIYAWDGELTYRELDELSTRLASHLILLGVLPGQIVPLCFEKSMWMSVAMIAAMKTGSTSIAMDTSLPEDRLHLIVKSVDASIILSSTANQTLAGRLTDKNHVIVAEQKLREAVCSSTALPKVHPSTPLYIVFTSGSTGIPKGAVITHRNLSSAIQHQQVALGFTKTSRVFDFASYAFDASWSNSLHTLTCGGCLCVPSDLARKNDIAGSIQAMKVTYADLTPSVARLINPSTVPSLTTLILAGEVVTREDANMWSSRVSLYNIYGPAECSMTATRAVVDLQSRYIENIGRGIGLTTWIVEGNGERLAPVGAVGELWLEGPLVGEGYFNDPIRTAVAFVEDPPWLLRGGPSYPGRRGRLYRTGDLVRYGEDGTLIFIGRKDEQVKIRGQRVELGEVEYYVRRGLIKDMTGVNVAVEIITPDDSQNQVLAAFISVDRLTNGSTEKTKETLAKMTKGLDKRLAEQIPGYMIPSVYVPVDEIPITITGKTDRRRLREMGGAKYQEYTAKITQSERLPPSNQMEESLLEVWAEVLNLTKDAVSTDSSFAQLGGDSITAMQVVSRCRARNITVTTGDVLRTRTIRKLALRCSSKITMQAPAHRDTESCPWTLSPIQRMFFDTYPSGLNHYNQSFLLRLTRQTAASEVRKALKAVVGRHPMLRARFQQDASGQWKQFLAKKGSQVFMFAHYSLDEKCQIFDIVRNRQQSLNILRGPVFAADLFNIGQEQQILFLVAHHLVIDLVSWRIILHDLEHIVNIGEAPPKQPNTFRTWSTLQQEETLSFSSADVLPFHLEKSNSEFWGCSSEKNTFGSCKKYHQSLDAKTTKLLLGRSNNSLGTEPNRNSFGDPDSLIPPGIS